MRINVPHYTDKETAKRRLDETMESLLQQHGSMATDIERQWTGDTLGFSFKARGFNIKGTVEVTDSEVILDGKLPLIAKPFEPRVRSTVEREAKQIFPEA